MLQNYFWLLDGNIQMRLLLRYEGQITYSFNRHRSARQDMKTTDFFDDVLGEEDHDQDMNLSGLAHHPIDLSCRWNYRDHRNELHLSRDDRPYFGGIPAYALQVPADTAAQPEEIK